MGTLPSLLGGVRTAKAQDTRHPVTVFQNRNEFHWAAWPNIPAWYCRARLQDDLLTPLSNIAQERPTNRQIWQIPVPRTGSLSIDIPRSRMAEHFWKCCVGLSISPGLASPSLPNNSHTACTTDIGFTRRFIVSRSPSRRSELRT